LFFSHAFSSLRIIHAYTSRHKFSDIPEDDEGMEKWLLQRWVEKDRLIAEFKRNPSSIGPPREDLFPNRGALPSIIPFIALVATFVVAAILTVYFSYNNKILLRLLIVVPPLGLLGAAVVVYVNLIPSSKGMARKNHNEPGSGIKAE
jgi:hypothetical protein